MLCYMLCSGPDLLIALVSQDLRIVTLFPYLSLLLGCFPTCCQLNNPLFLFYSYHTQCPSEAGTGVYI